MEATKNKQVVRQVDHIMIETGDPAALYQWFNEVLGLPVAWAMKDFGGFLSGGVCAGNVNLEFIRFKSARFGHPIEETKTPTGARISGIAFEPMGSAEVALKELDFREIPHTDSHRTPNWTEAVVSGLLDDPDVAFLTEYHFDFKAWRRSLQNELEKNSGGNLGLMGVREIHVKLNPSSVSETFWRKFLSPLQEAAPNSWAFEAGPRVRFSHGEGNSIASISMDVKSLPAAQTFLRQKELLGLSSDERILINPTAVQGIQIYLSQSSNG